MRCGPLCLFTVCRTQPHLLEQASIGGRAPERALGQGGHDVTAIEDGGDVGIVQGPQGGFHVWGGLRADGFDPGAQVRLDFELVQSGSVVARATYYDALARTEPEGPFEYAAVAVVIEKVEPRSVADLPATLRLSLTTEDGHVLEDELEVIPRCCDL